MHYANYESIGINPSNLGLKPPKPAYKKPPSPKIASGKCERVSLKVFAKELGDAPLMTTAPGCRSKNFQESVAVPLFSVL